MYVVGSSNKKKRKMGKSWTKSIKTTQMARKKMRRRSLKSSQRGLVVGLAKALEV